MRMYEYTEARLFLSHVGPRVNAFGEIYLWQQPFPHSIVLRSTAPRQKAIAVPAIRTATLPVFI